MAINRVLSLYEIKNMILEILDRDKLSGYTVTELERILPTTKHRIGKAMIELIKSGKVNERLLGGGVRVYYPRHTEFNITADSLKRLVIKVYGNCDCGHCYGCKLKKFIEGNYDRRTTQPGNA